VFVDKEHAKRLGTRVLGVFARAHVEHFGADVPGLVGNAFETAHHHGQRIQRIERHLVFAKQMDEVLDQFALSQVDAVLQLNRLARQLGVLLHERLDRVVQHRGRMSGELDELLARESGGHLAQFQQPPRDALGVVPDALELEVDANRAVGEAQRARHGLLADEELEAEPVDLLFLVVDVLVAQDDRVSELPVVFGHRSHTVLERDFRERTHFGDLGADAVDVTLERGFEIGRHAALRSGCWANVDKHNCARRWRFRGVYAFPRSQIHRKPIRSRTARELSSSQPGFQRKLSK